MFRLLPRPSIPPSMCSRFPGFAFHRISFLCYLCCLCRFACLTACLGMHLSPRPSGMVARQSRKIEAHAQLTSHTSASRRAHHPPNPEFEAVTGLPSVPASCCPAARAAVASRRQSPSWRPSNFSLRLLRWRCKVASAVCPWPVSYFFLSLSPFSLRTMYGCKAGGTAERRGSVPWARLTGDDVLLAASSERAACAGCASSARLRFLFINPDHGHAANPTSGGSF